jgi:hypothetical protein
MPDDRYIKMKALVENYKTFPMYIYINLRSLSTEMLNLRTFCITVISTCEAYYPCILLTEYRVPGFLYSRPNRVPLPPSPQESVAPSHLWVQGGRHTHLRGGGGGPNSDDGTDTRDP